MRTETERGNTHQVPTCTLMLSSLLCLSHESELLMTELIYSVFVTAEANLWLYNSITGSCFLLSVLTCLKSFFFNFFISKMLLLYCR